MTAPTPCVPIRLYGVKDLQRIVATLQPAVQAWARDWLPETAQDVALQAGAFGPADASGAPLSCCVGERADAWVGIGEPGAQAGLLLDLLAAVAPGSTAAQTPCAAGVLSAALEDLAGRLLAAATSSPSAQELVAWKRTSTMLAPAGGWGNVRLELTLERARLAAVLSVHGAQALLKKMPAAQAHGHRPALAERDSVIGDARVQLHVTLAPVEIELAEVLSVRPGDVLMFPHQVGEPVLVETADGRPLGRAELGGSKGRRAARFVDA